MYLFAGTSIHDTLISEKRKPMPAFMTFAEVVMKASRLRLSAIQAIGREFDVAIDTLDRRCIDGNLLEKLADAHVRQLKSYFNHTKRHLKELTGAELAAFVDFCELSKNATPKATLS